MFLFVLGFALNTDVVPCWLAVRRCWVLLIFDVYVFGVVWVLSRVL